MNFLDRLKNFFKNLYENLKHRLKPRATFSWIFSAVIWLLILAYLGFGIYVGLSIYKDKINTPLIKTATYFYPFPAAYVNGKVIWANDYYRQLTYIEHFSNKTNQAIPDISELRRQIIDQLAEDRILEFEALRHNLRISASDVQSAYDEIVAQVGGEVEVRKVLNELYGMSEREFKKLVRSQVVKEKIRAELIAQVKISHIFIKDEGRANEIADRAKGGEDFGELAKQYSEDSNSRDQGGQLDWLARGQLVFDGQKMPEFDEAAFAAEKGEIIGPIKTGAGFEIARIEDKKGSINEEFDVWLKNLIEQAKIWRFIK